MNNIKKNELPYGHKSWTAYLLMLRLNHPEYYNHQIINDEYRNSPEGIIRYEIELDYAKARAFDELGQFPTLTDLMESRQILNGQQIQLGRVFDTTDFLTRVANLVTRKG